MMQTATIEHGARAYEPYGEYDARDEQLAWHRDMSRVVALIGGVGAGKTLPLCHEALKLARWNPGLLGLIAAPTYRMIEDVILPTFFDFVLPESGIAEFNKQQMKVVLADRARTPIIFRSVENPERLRGLNLAWVLGDETPLWRERAFDILLGRIRDPRATLSQFKFVGNPRGFNWVHERFIAKPVTGYSLYRTSTFANKALPKDYVDSLLASYSERFAQQELYGQFISMEGLVYEEFSRKLHVVNGLREEVLRHLESQHMPLVREGGLDFGWTNPTALLDFVAIDHGGEKGLEVYQIGEFYKTRQQPEALAAYILGRDYMMLACDPSGGAARQESGGKSMVRALRHSGVSGIKYRQSQVVAGIRLVSRYVRDANGKVRFYIDSRCVSTIREYETYAYPETPEGKPVREMPVETYNHAMDATRYYFVNKFPLEYARFEI